VAEQVLAHAGRPEAVGEIEISSFARDLFNTGEERPAELSAALNRLRQADLAVVATPVYKASYTGLLKSFLDHLAAGELAGVVAVPVVVAGSPAHTFVGEQYLRPLLTELGAIIPTPAFTISEPQMQRVDEAVVGWVERYSPAVIRQLGLHPLPPGAHLEDCDPDEPDADQLHPHELDRDDLDGDDFERLGEIHAR
jgi:FMN reductase